MIIFFNNKKLSYASSNKIYNLIILGGLTGKFIVYLRIIQISFGNLIYSFVRMFILFLDK